MVNKLRISRGIFTVACFLFLMIAGLILPGTSLAKLTYDLVIHYINPTVNQNGNAYDVMVYFSILDDTGKLQKGFEVNDFSIVENGNQKSIESLEQVNDEKMSVIVVLDASVSSQRMKDEKDAVSDFIKDLERDDIVGIIRFDNEVETVVDLTTDHDEAEDKLKKVKFTSEGDNCLYDATFNAVKMMAKQPAGRRSIIVLTDAEDRGYDSSKACSSNTDDDIIDLANNWNTRVPIYTIGITEAVDEKTLQRISERTGGRYLFSKNSGDIAGALNDLSNQFQNEYVIRYTSNVPPGEYTLVLEVDHKSTSDGDTRSVIYSEQLAGTSPSTTSPSTISPEPTKAELATVREGQSKPTDVAVLPTPIIAPPEPTTNNTFMFVIIGVVGVICILLIVLIITISKRGSRKSSNAKPASSTAAPVADATYDGLTSEKALEQTIGTLTVLASDDAAMIGKTLIITHGRTTIGRGADNDIVLPQDRGVSRQHIVLELMGKDIFITEAISQDGKRPTYGTFINEQKLGATPQVLLNGVEIRLGNHCHLRFERLKSSSTEATTAEQEITQDGEDSERTVQYHAGVH